MIDILVPKQYVNEPGILAEAGGCCAAYSKRIFIVAGKTAFSKIHGALLPSFEAAGIVYSVFEYAGYPTHEAARKFASLAREFNAGAIAAAGGGRIMDTGKAAGGYAALPVIAIPTTASTCACWAAVSVMYDDEGVMTAPLFNSASPALIIADTDIIARAPPRYMRGGIADTLAKWYESYPNLLTSGDFYLRLVTRCGAFARDILESLGLQVMRDIENNIFNYDEIREVIDCIFSIAGFCGAVRTLTDTQGLAHPFYNASTAVPTLRDKLHGEKVAFGLVMQAFIEGRETNEIEHRIDIFKKLRVPLTLRELGIDYDFESVFEVIFRRMRESTPRYPGMERPWTRDELYEAILKVDEYAQKHGAERGVVYKKALDGVKPFKAARSLESARREFGLSEVLKLAGNENMYGPSPKALAVLARVQNEVSYYPDTGVTGLRSALAAKLGVAEDELLFGNGSFECLSFAALAVLEAGSEAVIPSPSFGWYTICARAENAAPVFVPLRRHKVDLDATLRAITANTRLIWLCNPNNPTGSYFTAAELDAFLLRVPPSILVVLDEAYINFAPADAPDTLSLFRQHTNIISLRTFSKIYGLAGLRIGYAVGNRALIEVISRVRAPVNINTLAQEAARAALDDEDFYRYVLAENAKGRELYYAELTRLGIEYIPTAGNFIMFNTGRAAGEIELEFIKRGILVRNGAEFGMPSWIRVTIGAEAQNRRVLSVLEKEYT